jgi:hypothetical protein
VARVGVIELEVAAVTDDEGVQDRETLIVKDGVEDMVGVTVAVGVVV